MGNYNPHAPNILGQEWVPIRDENVTFSPAVDSVELGHEFSLTTSRILADARFYLSSPPPAQVDGQVVMASIYPQGTEDLSGPIRSVIIPCNAGGVTGGGFNSLTAANVPIFLANPSDGSYIECTPNFDANTKHLEIFFATNQYSQLLTGKRILAVNLLHSFSWDPIESGTGVVAPVNQVFTINQDLAITTNAQLARFAPLVDYFGNGLMALNPPVGRPPQALPISVIHFGEIDQLWNTPTTTTERMPWRYGQLQRFEASAGTNRYSVNYYFGGLTAWAGIFYLNYAALQVIYCEEQRVAWGARAFGGSASGTGSTAQYGLGTNVLPMRDRSFSLNPTLGAGDYTVVLSSPSIGDLTGPIASGTTIPAQANSYPNFNGLRQLYALPEQRGVQVNIPTPIENHLEETFTKTETQVLPQISLHTSGGPLTEVHVYGRQVAAQVYGSITPEQEIYDDLLTGNTVYDQVRFYARRFGDTSVPLEVFGVGGTTGSGNITPADFDALTEIISGWKQVTLTLTTNSTMGTLAPPAPRFRFQALGELAGNRWEVLGASAPALSGIPGNLYNLVPTPNQLYEATYQPPGGSQAELGWVPQGVGSPWVSAGSDDDSSDAVLMFAQSLPTITGFSVATATQTLTGIGLDCGLNPCCIPTALIYNRITWPVPVNTGVARDDFNRSVGVGWGTASDGHVWTTSGTAADFLVTGTEGRITPSALGGSRLAWVNVGGPDQDITIRFKISDSPESGALVAGIVGRLTTAADNYRLEFRYNFGANSDLRIRKNVASVTTTLASMDVIQLATSQTRYMYLRFQLKGNILMAKVWGVNVDEPDWMLVIADTSITTGNNAGALARDDTGATASNFFFDDFSVNPPNYWFGSYELQRMDTVDTTWQTIMKATPPATTGFSDFEARVGIASSYRIRGVDVYDFAGPWSNTVTITIPSPGASGGCISQGHVLLFSTNERQDGSSNLAYSSVWEGLVSEDFSFPESSFVQLQAMYNKDFFTAFRPSERGGEQFQRTVLVQAAAISPPTLADFTSLRDMAWEDVSYICVRDEGGNRWFATVVVPSGRVLHNRKLYLAPVQVIEVTDTPSEVDP